MKKRKVKSWIIILFFALFLILFIYSGYKIVKWKIDSDKNNNINAETKENIKIKNEEEPYKYDVDFNKLKKQNSDTVAYLKVKGTDIDYVVVKSNNNNNYYLKHNFNKENNVAGWIFADYRNKFDGTDRNIVVYGHNMKNGSMFGTLKNVLTENWQENEQNLKIVFITERKEYLFQVFSTYSIKAEEYYINTEFESNQSYTEFLNTIKNRSNHNYNVEISPIDKVLTLSSCNSDGSKRIVLHAKLITKDL